MIYDIRHLIGKYVKLHPLGDDYRCRCPLHPTEKLQMVVSPELNYFECLECGCKGNAGEFAIALRKRRFPKPRYGRLTVFDDEITGSVYVLKLEGERYYVGFTQHLDDRISCHFSRKAAGWSREFAPLEILEIYEQVPIGFENELTENYIRKYGWENVRGGDYAYLLEIKERRKKPIGGVYLLRCYGGYFYIGFADDMVADILLQMTGQGCEWTRLHQPYKVVSHIRTNDRGAEKDLTLKIMKRYSWRRVRGSIWQALTIQRPAELANPAVDHLLAGNFYIS